MYDKYDHYIAVDWAQSNMAIARMSREGRCFRGETVILVEYIFLRL